MPCYEWPSWSMYTNVIWIINSSFIPIIKEIVFSYFPESNALSGYLVSISYLSDDEGLSWWYIKNDMGLLFS